MYIVDALSGVARIRRFEPVIVITIAAIFGGEISARSFHIMKSRFGLDSISSVSARDSIDYNFVKPHQTLTKAAGGTPTTPAMAAMLATRPYSYEDVIALLDSKI